MDKKDNMKKMILLFGTQQEDTDFSFFILLHIPHKAYHNCEAAMRTHMSLLPAQHHKGQKAA